MSEGRQRSTDWMRGGDLDPLRTKDRPHVSDRQIAKGLGIDHKTVSAQRERLETIGEIPQCDRQTKDGRVYPAQRQPVKPTPEPTRHIALFSAAAPHAAAPAGQVAASENQWPGRLTNGGLAV